MPLNQKRKTYHHGDLRDQLLEAVRQLIEEHGPDGFSIAEACRIAGVSTAAPYKHFRDREDILHGVVRAAMQRMGAAMQAAADSHTAGDPARVVALGRSYVEFARTEPGIFALMFGLAGAHPAPEDLSEEGRAKFGIVIRVVAEHMARPADDPEVVLRAYALWCAVHGHAFLVLDGKFRDTGLTITEDAYLALAGAAYLGPGAAPAY